MTAVHHAQQPDDIQLTHAHSHTVLSELVPKYIHTTQYFQVCKQIYVGKSSDGIGPNR